MAKDPAFLFYPNDWTGGTMHLSFECKGAYFDLLMLQFNRGHMTIDMIAHVLGQSMDKIWPQIQDKFQTDGKVFWNERLREEKEKRVKFTESRRNNKKGSNQFSKKEKDNNHMLGHMTSHMENENEDVNEIVFGNKKESRISIKKVYAGDKVKIIYDLRAYFADRVEDFARAGWTAYDAFMTANPAAVFEDDTHLYNSYRKFCTTATKKSQQVDMSDL
jgi:uncharacterized protein YdaU (DUF1376 family)